MKLVINITKGYCKDDSVKLNESTKEEKSIDSLSSYARFFDETCVDWTCDAEYNLAFLTQNEAYANAKLRSQGYLFLNDVYDMLGMRKTKVGQAVGWVYNEKNPIGDNYVSFGIHDECNENFVNGFATNAWLDFNVDGAILEHIEEGP